MEVDNGQVDTTSQTPDNEQSAQQDSVQKAINKQHAKYREEERKRLAAEAELAELRGKLEEKNKPEAPIVPPMPDQFDDNFEELMVARESKLKELVEYEAKQKLESEVISKQQEAQQAKQQEELQQRVTNYSDRALKMGVDSQELEQAGTYVAQSGISEEIASFLLDDEQGPLLVKHLADNPIELDELRGMPIAQAIIKIHSEVRSKVSVPTNNVTSAPDPVRGISGKPVEDIPEIIRGATFK